MESQQVVEDRRKRFTDIFNQILLNVRMIKNEAPVGSAMLSALHEFEGRVMTMLEHHGNR